MPATIRLTRIGKKHKPFYRIIVVDKRKKRDGRYIENLGFYNPLLKETSNSISINDESLARWQSKGAVVSEGLRKLLIRYKKSKKV